jgi:hypothetical protein
MMKINLCVDELLRRGSDDWVSASEVAGVAKFTGGVTTLDEIRKLSLEMVEKVILEGYMKIGDVKKDGFHEWTCSPQEAISKVGHIWQSFKEWPRVGDICWLAITQNGVQVFSEKIK